jgi:hypothetical protein
MSDYLYTVAVIATTYVGFSTVFVTFGQALRDTMSKYDLLLVKNILYLGMIVIVGCLLPPLLRLMGAGPGLTFRLPSLLTAVAVLVFCIIYPKARRQATDRAMPTRVRIDMALVYAAGVLFLANAAAVVVPSSLAIHALAVTVLLVAVFLAFPFGLDLLPEEPAKPVEGQGVQQQDRSEARSGVRRGESQTSHR